MLKSGIYEQIINQLFEEKISSIDQERFYIDKRFIKKSEVAKLLSLYLTKTYRKSNIKPMGIQELRHTQTNANTLEYVRTNTR